MRNYFLSRIRSSHFEFIANRLNSKTCFQICIKQKRFSFALIFNICKISGDLTAQKTQELKIFDNFLFISHLNSSPSAKAEYRYTHHNINNNHYR